MSNQQEWDENLDAMIAAPEHHKILLENSQVRVLDSWIKPGETTPVHTHRWASVLYILGTSDFIRYDADGNIIFDSRNSTAKIENGTALWSQPLTPHFVKNIGDGEIHVISVELKDS
jgi:quercetin dioxygenase-like cupin family protein